MEQEPIIQTTNNVQSRYTTRKQFYFAIFKWFVPAGIITGLLVGLGLAGFCILFCSPTPIENIFIILGLGSIPASLIYVPIISAKKIAQADSRRSLILQTIGLSLLGYLIIIAIVFPWLVVSNSKVEGWQPSINERMLNWIQHTVGNIQDNTLGEINKVKFNDQSFNFNISATDISLVNSHDSVLTIIGTLDGLNGLSDSGAMSQYNLVISEIAVGGKVAQSDVAKRLKGKHSSLGEEVDSGLINLNNGDSQQVTVSASFPKDFAEIIKSDPNTTFKIKLELLSESPYTYQKFNFTSIWSKEIEITPKYLGQFLKDSTYGGSIYYKLPQDAVVFDSNGNFVTASNYNTNFTITTNPQASKVPELNVISINNSNVISVKDYLNTLPWHDQIVTEQISPVSSFQLAIVEAKPDKNSPYKAFIFSRYGDIIIYELMRKNSVLEDLYNQYLEDYKKLVKF